MIERKLHFLLYLAESPLLQYSRSPTFHYLAKNINYKLRTSLSERGKGRRKVSRSLTELNRALGL
ncbi:MAG: hypothetical protein ACOCUV_02865, partial [bacterium]